MSTTVIRDLNRLYSGTASPFAIAGESDPMQDTLSLSLQPVTGPAARAYIIHPDDLAAMIGTLSDRDPVKACEAKEALEVLLAKVFPTIGEFYVSSADHPGRSVAEVKLIGLGLLS